MDESRHKWTLYVKNAKSHRTQVSRSHTANHAHHHDSSCVFCQTKRAVYFATRALYSVKRALHSVNRAQYSIKTAQHLTKRALLGTVTWLKCCTAARAIMHTT